MRKVLYLMGALNDQDVDWLGRTGQVQSVKAGTTLIREGIENHWFYIVLEGRLAVTLEGGVTVAKLRQGEVLGEISLLDSRPPSASVVGIEDASVLALHHDVLRAKLAADHGFGARFYRSIGVFLADRLRALSGQFGYLSRKGDLAETAVGSTADELDDLWTENVALAASRFDGLLRSLESR